MSEITPIEWTDEKVKKVTREIINDGKNREWSHVHDGLKEIAHMSGSRGLSKNQFLALRKDIIQAIEKFEPFAKSYIEIAEKGLQ
ncbi:hypothetical protein DRO61_04615 [Candidatus Bathyarchaeota archaeon]|nr:MAG: hypothetical protein DRO61_04615 [Candidatus Bathyarchaeota archaeon]